MPADDVPALAVTAFAERARTELARFDDLLAALFTELEQLDPDLAARAAELMGSREFAAMMLLGPLDQFNGKSALQTALERRVDPLTMEIPPHDGGDEQA